MNPVTRPLLVAAVGSPCPWCGEPMTLPDRPPSRDHLHPRSRGGTCADTRNRAIVCEPCNNLKGGRSLAGFLQKLIDAGDVIRAARVAAFMAGRNPMRREETGRSFDL